MRNSFCFFFSSRRRHTRSDRDWSSDVCSSDLHFSSVGQKSLDRDFLLLNEGHDLVKSNVDAPDQSLLHRPQRRVRAVILKILPVENRSAHGLVAQHRDTSLVRVLDHFGRRRELANLIRLPRSALNHANAVGRGGTLEGLVAAVSLILDHKTEEASTGL